MEEQNNRRQRFFGYPRAVEAPAAPFVKTDDVNPVFRGFILVIGAWLLVSHDF
jgi:hypothetical protein